MLAGVSLGMLVCRNIVGQFLGVSVVIFDGRVDLAILEAHACNEALALAEDLHPSRVVIAAHCLEVVSIISNGAMAVY